LSSTDTPPASAASTPERFSGAKGVWVLIAVVVVAILLLVALAEGTVRARQWLRHGSASGHDALYTHDAAARLRVLRPGAQQAGVTINAHGFRGPPLESPKPSKRIRIAYVGASTTFCAEVPDAQVWAQIATAALQREFPNASFDFINAGVPGYSVDSSLRHFQRYVREQAPDAVMVYHATNDMSYELRSVAVSQGLWEEDAKVESWLSRYSLLADLVEKNLRVRKAGQEISSGTRRLALEPAALGKGFARDLNALLKESADAGRHVSIATFSTRLRREQNEQELKAGAVSALVYMPFMSLDGLLDAYARYNAVIRDVAGQSRALLIDGENTIPGDAEHFVDSVHFSAKGNQAMAQRVAGALARDPAFRAMVQRRTEAP
jgi:lysophospholipase L1-like esterase